MTLVARGEPCFDPHILFDSFETLEDCFRNFGFSTIQNRRGPYGYIIQANSTLGDLVTTCIDAYCQQPTELQGCEGGAGETYGLYLNPVVGINASACHGIASDLNQDIGGPGVLLPAPCFP